MKINNTKTLGETIRARRKELHYTQAYLAEFTGLSVTFISDVERGKTTAEIEKIIRLINVLGLNLLVEKREWLEEQGFEGTKVIAEQIMSCGGIRNYI